MNKSLELAKQLSNSIDSIHEYRKELNTQISIADQKRTDIEHVMEMSQDKNASEGYALYKLMREVLRERRVIKDAMDEIDILLRFIKSKGFEPNHGMPKVIEGIENKVRLHDKNEELRTYRVRVMTEIFGTELK